MSYLDFSHKPDKDGLLAHAPDATTVTRDDSYFYAEPEKKKQKCEKLGKLRGILLMLLGVFFLDCARFFVKLSYSEQPALSPIQNAFGKFSGMLIVSLIMAIGSCDLKSVLCGVPDYLRLRFFIRCLLFTAVSTLQGFALK